MRTRVERDYGLSSYDAATLTADRDIAEYFEAVARELPSDPKLCANWVMGETSAYINDEGKSFDRCPLSPGELAQLLTRIKDGTVSGKMAKEVFRQMWTARGDEVTDWKSRQANTDENLADQIIESQGLKQISDPGALEKLVRDVIAENPKSVEEFRSGKEKAFNALVGQVMKASKGKANPAQVSETLMRNLNEF
jgi:aspartyl-tRNA(Asn)/glutamyl-tRNA(Gln) amidotransferase subunit B